MEAIANFKDPDIGKVLMPTFGVFTPILEEKRDTILSTKKVTLEFGRTMKLMMDVYYPDAANVPEGHDAAVLFFFYGGGFTTGGRTLCAPYDLVYANIGWYFAQRGIVTIIPDYRLVPEVQFPSAADDVYQAVSWAIENRDKIIEEGGDLPYRLDFDSVFLMGHGSGVVHLATALFMPGLLTGDPDTKDRMAGVILVAGTYNTRALPEDDVVADVLAQYWGTFEATKRNSPQALLESAPEDLVAILPDILLVDGEKEPYWLEVGAGDFHKVLAERTAKREETVRVANARPDDAAASSSATAADVELGTVTRLIAVGHNHISVHLSPGSGEGEEWAEAVIKWMKAVLKERVIPGS